MTPSPDLLQDILTQLEGGHFSTGRRMAGEALADPATPESLQPALRWSLVRAVGGGFMEGRLSQNQVWDLLTPHRGNPIGFPAYPWSPKGGLNVIVPGNRVIEDADPAQVLMIPESDDGVRVLAFSRIQLAESLAEGSLVEAGLYHVAGTLAGIQMPPDPPAQTGWALLVDVQDASLIPAEIPHA